MTKGWEEGIGSLDDPALYRGNPAALSELG